jgi:hypothetical protein
MCCNEHFKTGQDPECEKCMRARSRCHQYKCPQDHAHGILCHAHFDAADVRRWEQAECLDCQRAAWEEAHRIQTQHTIDPKVPYGRHIPLTCENHPHLRWSTKNIDYIGARSIFYFGSEPECKCSARFLRPLREDEKGGDSE